VSAYVSRCHPEIADTFRVKGNEKYRIKVNETEPEQLTEAYLDVETTGLTPAGCDITVIGIHICNNGDSSFTQLVGKDITEHSILEALQGVSALYTYKGRKATHGKGQPDRSGRPHGQ
jgi:uncharacterized protein YprB with RNaseH-like and TPR domain